MKTLCLAVLVMLVNLKAFAAHIDDVKPNPIRYRDSCFINTIVISNVVFGNNKTQAKVDQNLKCDIYQPDGDTLEKRPLIILAHGGYFLFGEKESFTVECNDLAKAGYVAVTIDYRLLDVKESEISYKRAVIDAVNDMKAAVRFFYKDALTDNFYRIDTNNIFIGGYSAGAITTLHYAYATTVKDAFEMGGKAMLRYIDAHGGIDGDSGNPGYSIKVRGAINISGSLHHASLVDKDEPILFSVHGTNDDIVPFNTGKSGGSKVETEGSSLIHKRANEVGLKNKLIEIEGGDHSAFFIDCPDCPAQLRAFIADNLKK